MRDSADASSDAIGAEATRLEGVRLEAVGLETALSEADTAVSDFFAVDRPGPDFANSSEIGDEIVRLGGCDVVGLCRTTQKSKYCCKHY